VRYDVLPDVGSTRIGVLPLDNELVDFVYGYDQYNNVVLLSEGTDYIRDDATTLSLYSVGDIQENDNGKYSVYVTRKLKLSYYIQKLRDVELSDITSAFSGFEKPCLSLDFPKILIAPGYSHELAVGREMVATAAKIRAMAYVDAAEGLTPTEAVQFKSTNYGDERVMFCYP
jgi:Phage tail sheath protein FI